MSRRAATRDVFTAIADPTRRSLLDLLRSGERSVQELARPFRMTRPALSQHLRVLREAELVTQRRAGRKRLYQIDPRKLKSVADWVAQYERFWTQKLLALGKHLEKES